MNVIVQAAPRERPIPFSAPMVRAILDGRKTQTRRIVKNLPADHEHAEIDFHGGQWKAWDTEYPDEGHVVLRCPYGQSGDRLWVREPWRVMGFKGEDARIEYSDGDVAKLECGDDDVELWTDRELTRFARLFGDSLRRIPWRPSMFLPRWASRITLKIVGVRVERVQAITEEDAIAEGMRFNGMWWLGADHPIKGVPKSLPSARQAFKSLWDGIHAKHHERQWATNPFVWRIEFRRVKP